MKQEYFVVGFGPLNPWEVATRSHTSYRGLCSSRFSSRRLFFRIRIRRQLCPHGFKVANYNALKSEADTLRARYQNLQKVVSETNVQMASLQLIRQGSFGGVRN